MACPACKNGIVWKKKDGKDVPLPCENCLPDLHGEWPKTKSPAPAPEQSALFDTTSQHYGTD